MKNNYIEKILNYVIYRHEKYLSWKNNGTCHKKPREIFKLKKNIEMCYKRV